MRPYLYTIFLFSIIMLWASCRKDFEYAPSSGNLEFSRDTVFLDTVFTSIGSSTYALKVYNRTRDDVEIPLIRLGQGENSNYRLNVDGVAGNEFQNITMLARDSLFIFIETTYDISVNNALEFLYTDVIEFDTGENLQEVQLVTLVKDATFLYSRTLSDNIKETLLVGIDDMGKEIRIEGFYLTDDELHLTNEKPYVIYGYAAVPEGKELSMDPGTRVHFHKDSGVFVSEGGVLKITGDLSMDQEVLENEVIFKGDRLEPEFEDVPGQWGTIWLSKGSLNNEINHLTIKNATVGLLVEGDEIEPGPTLILKNTQIHNSASINFWGKTARIFAENCVFGSAGNSSLYCNAGGEYTFLHTTIANYWTKGFRTGPALRIDNFISNIGFDLVKAHFINCIIDGSSRNELNLKKGEGSLFNYYFSNCLITYVDSNVASDALYDFEDSAHYNIIYLNQDAYFREPTNHDFRIGEMSFGKGKGDLNVALSVPFDILGLNRTNSPDIGAHITTPED